MAGIALILDLFRADFIQSTYKYRLIVHPKSIRLEENCSLSTCTERVEVRPRCPNTREYLVKFGVNPRKFGPGEFNSYIDLWLFDRFGAPANEAYDINRERTISGVFLMPWAELVKSSAKASEVVDLIHGRRSSVQLEITNTGNRPLRLRSWDREDPEDKTITLDAPECQNRALDVGASCTVTLKNLSRNAATGKYITWYNHSPDEDDLFINLYLAPRRDGSVEYNVKNN